MVRKPIGYSPADARLASRSAGNVSHWLAPQDRSTGNKDAFCEPAQYAVRRAVCALRTRLCRECRRAGSVVPPMESLANMSATRRNAADYFFPLATPDIVLFVHITRFASALFISLIEAADTAMLLLSQAVKAIHAPRNPWRIVR